MWYGSGKRILWQIDSEWSDRSSGHRLQYTEYAGRILSLYTRGLEERLSKDEYAWLAEQGAVKTNGDYDGYFKAEWQIVILASKEIQDKLLAIGEGINYYFSLDLYLFKKQVGNFLSLTGKSQLIF